VELAGLAAEDVGHSDDRAPLVFLHGLTFDRTMWHSTIEHLDPGRRAVALDLPGHGESQAWENYDIEAVTDGVRRAVDEAGLDRPIVVGHSLAAVVATVYGSRYPTRGVVNVDQALQVAGFAGFVQSIAAQLRSPAFPELWKQFAASMHAELLPDDARKLVETTTNPRQEVVLGYWREVLDSPVEEIAALMANALAALRDERVPYLFVSGSEPEPAYRAWLAEELPQAEIVVFEGSGHFPHLAHPDRLAALLTGI